MGISVQSAFPLKIIGSVFVKGKNFPLRIRHQLHNQMSLADFSLKYTCLIAVMVPKKEKIIVKINNTFEKKIMKKRSK